MPPKFPFVLELLLIFFILLFLLLFISQNLSFISTFKWLQVFRKNRKVWYFRLEWKYFPTTLEVKKASHCNSLTSAIFIYSFIKILLAYICSHCLSFFI